MLRSRLGTRVAGSRGVHLGTPALLALLLASVMPSSASAQVFTMPTRSGSPREREGGGLGGTLQVTAPIGRRDCESEVWRFVINYAGFGTTRATQLQYYLGVDAMACGMSTQRYPNASGGSRCWPIQQTPSLTVSNPTVPFSYTVEIQARYLVDPLNGDCSNPSTTQGTAGTNYISLLASPPSDSNLVSSFPVTFDVEPPEAPFNIAATPGEGGANVQWDYTSVTSTSDAGTTSAPPADLQGFWILCDPPPNAAAVEDGGVTDAGHDAGLPDEDEDASTGGGTCESSGLELLDVNNTAQFEQYRCSDLLSAASVRGSARGLTNGRAYRVAVVAQDLAGNRSTVAISSACVTPQPVTDFWESYRGAGGAAQPGLCNARPGRLARPSALLWAGLGAMVATALRRRRKQ